MRSPRTPLTFQIALTGAALALQVAGAPLGGSAGLCASCLAILALGLPHGALDLQRIRLEGRRGLRGLWPLIGVYLAAAAAALLVWRASPVLALGLFLLLAAVHFAEDWPELPSRFLAQALSAGLLCAPALLHRSELSEIFLNLTGRPLGAEVGEILLLAAPVALAGSSVAVLTLARGPRPQEALAAGISLLGLILLPPALGFALYFGLCHSPRHFGEALKALSIRRAAQWIPLAAPTSVAALVLGGALYLSSGAQAPSFRLVSATFMLLFILTVPHMLVPLLLKLFDAAARRAAPAAPPLASSAPAR